MTDEWKPTGRLRWVDRCVAFKDGGPFSLMKRKVLQQEWFGMFSVRCGSPSEYSVSDERRTEWRDVPTEDEG